MIAYVKIKISQSTQFRAKMIPDRVRRTANDKQGIPEVKPEVKKMNEKRVDFKHF